MSENVDVLVVGAGLAGLSAGMFLAQQGIRTLCVERHTGLAEHPRASGQTPRTMELFHWAGVDDAIRAASGRTSHSLRITIATSLRGQVLHRIVEDAAEFDGTAASAAGWGMAGQEVVEPILAERFQALGGTLRLNTELLGFEQDDDGVTAHLRDRADGREGDVRARYLVGADGGRSPIREQLGIDRVGLGTVGHLIGAVFLADLGADLSPERTELVYLRGERFSGALINTDFPNRYCLGVDYDPTRESPADYPPQRLVELIRIATDSPELEPEIVWTRPWEMAGRIATSFRSGRVLLAGDAVKLTPPTGGLGGNTAVGDGHDLAWKLGAVLRGEAGPGLLDSYEAERRPIAEMVVTTSMHNAKHRMRPDLDVSGLGEPVDHMGIVLGFRYRSDAVLSGTDDGLPAEDPSHPSARAGFRAPHVPVRVADRAEVQSTMDLFGRGWVLFTGPDGEDRRKQAAECLPAPEVFVPGVDFTDVDGDFARVYRLAGDAVALVRPDGILAWRSDDVPEPAGGIAAVFDRLLARN